MESLVRDIGNTSFWYTLVDTLVYMTKYTRETFLYQAAWGEGQGRFWGERVRRGHTLHPCAAVSSRRPGMERVYPRLPAGPSWDGACVPPASSRAVPGWSLARAVPAAVRENGPGFRHAREGVRRRLPGHCARW